MSVAITRAQQFSLSLTPFFSSASFADVSSDPAIEQQAVARVHRIGIDGTVCAKNECAQEVAYGVHRIGIGGAVCAKNECAPEVAYGVHRISIGGTVCASASVFWLECAWGGGTLPCHVYAGKSVCYVHASCVLCRKVPVCLTVAYGVQCGEPISCTACGDRKVVHA